MFYITNTSLPSNSANTFQALMMCNEFNKINNNTVFIFPGSKKLNTKEFKEIETFLNEEIQFKFKEIYSVDFNFIKALNEKLWFFFKIISYNLFLTIFLLSNKTEQIYVREKWSLRIILILKFLGLLKNQVFFEAHDFKFKSQLLLNYCDKIIVINQQLKNVYSNFYSKPILVSHDAVSRNELTKYEIKETLNKRPNILYTGSFFKWKGVDLIIYAAKLLPNVNFLLIGGDNENYIRLNNFIIENNIKNVKLLHKINRKELHKYYLNSDILILPNLDEKINNWTSPLKLFEYMAVKRLIIASNIESLREILIHNHNSILFNPNIENDLVDKINFSVKNYNKDLVVNAFEDVKEYTWTNRANQILNFIE